MTIFQFKLIYLWLERMTMLLLIILSLIITPSFAANPLFTILDSVNGVLDCDDPTKTISCWSIDTDFDLLRNEKDFEITNVGCEFKYITFDATTDYKTYNYRMKVGIFQI